MIINGNALDVLKRMEDESVHMGATSSPYYGLRDYGTEPQIWDSDPKCNHIWETVHPSGYRKNDSNPGPLQHEGNTNRQNLKSDICSKCGAPWERITKKGEFVNQSWGGEHIKGIQAVGGVGKTSCLKTGGVCETITVGWEPSCKCYNDAREMGNKKESNEEFLSHPKENEMWARLIQMEVEKPIVIDMFGGSSSTGVACKQHNREYVGIELNPEYCKLGEQRIKEGK